MTYKPDTGVIEESPGIALAQLLGNAGYEVRVYDPVATEAALEALGGLAEGVVGCGAARAVRCRRLPRPGPSSPTYRPTRRAGGRHPERRLRVPRMMMTVEIATGRAPRRRYEHLAE